MNEYVTVFPIDRNVPALPANTMIVVFLKKPYFQKIDLSRKWNH